MTNVRFAIVGLLATCVLVASAQAGAPTDQAREYTDLVMKVLEDRHLKPQDRRAAVRKVANEVFDVGETAKRALGRHWQSRSPAEREEDRLDVPHDGLHPCLVALPREVEPDHVLVVGSAEPQRV